MQNIEIFEKRKSRRKKRNENKSKRKRRRTETCSDDNIESQILKDDN